MRRDTPYIVFSCSPYEFIDEGAVDSAVQFSLYDQDMGRQEVVEQFQRFLQAIGYPLSPTEELKFVDHADRSTVQDAIEQYATMHGNVFKKGEQ
jgi:hypothetical protein|tara:strand:- start:1606 stop:1887 length:282 start_codon:yes stop_codon:yes gene_type:complete